MGIISILDRKTDSNLKVTGKEVKYYSSINFSSTDTVTLSKTWGIINSSTSLEGVYTVWPVGLPTVPKSGKRVIFIHFTFRSAHTNGYPNYDDWFKPSNQGGSATFTFGGEIPTLLQVGRSAYNATASYVLEADLNTSGSDTNPKFDWDNSSYTPSINDAGGAAIAIYVFDYVDSWAATHDSYDENGSASTTPALDLGPGGSGDGWTATAKLITGMASNPGNDVNPHWTKGTGETDSTYIVENEGDNGTNEVTESSYAFFQSGNPTNMTGYMGLDSGSASAGLGYVATHIRFKPS